MSNIYTHSGDLGDIIYGMKCLKEINDPESAFYCVNRNVTKAFTKERFDTIAPLIEAQPYIGSVHYGEPSTPSTHPMEYYRTSWAKDSTIYGRHCHHLNLPKRPHLPWLSVGDYEKNYDVIFHRTRRYTNDLFPWKQVAEYFGDRALVIGFPEERRALMDLCGRTLREWQPKDFLELAKKIRGCSCYVGNQSSPMAIAIGVGANVIQETYLALPDCSYPGIQHVTDRYVTINDQLITGFAHTNVSNIPGGQWQYKSPKTGKFFKMMSLNMLCKKLIFLEGGTKEELIEEILKQTSLRVGAIHKTNSEQHTIYLAIKKNQKHNTTVEPTSINHHV